MDRATEVMSTQGRLRALLRATRAVVEPLELPVVLRRIIEAAVELVDAEYGALGVATRRAGSSSSSTSGCRPTPSRRSATCPRAMGCSARSSPTRGRSGSTTSARIPGPSASRQGIRRCELPRRADPRPRRGLRQPLPHQSPRRRLQRRGRAAPRGARGDRGVRGRERPAVRRGAHASGLDGRVRRAGLPHPHDRPGRRHRGGGGPARAPGRRGPGRARAADPAHPAAPRAHRSGPPFGVRGARRRRRRRARRRRPRSPGRSPRAAARSCATPDSPPTTTSTRSPSSTGSGAARWSRCRCDRPAPEARCSSSPWARAAAVPARATSRSPTTSGAASRSPSNSPRRAARAAARRAPRGPRPHRARSARPRHPAALRHRPRTRRRRPRGSATTPRPRRCTSRIRRLDDTIAQIRSLIFAITAPDHGRRTARIRIDGTRDEASANLARPVDVHFDGPVDLLVEGRLLEEATAVVRELLMNAVRHAQAEVAQPRGHRRRARGHDLRARRRPWHPGRGAPQRTEQPRGTCRAARRRDVDPLAGGRHDGPMGGSARRDLEGAKAVRG